MVSVAFPAFLLGRDPKERVLCVSYANELALKHARDFELLSSLRGTKNSFRKPFYEDVEEIVETTQRGFRRAASLTADSLV